MVNYERVLFGLLWLIILSIAGIALFRALRRRITSDNRQNIHRAMLAALISAACIFIITYWSAWTGFRQFVAIGPFGPTRMHYDYLRIDSAIAHFAEEHGHYPDSLKEAFSSDKDSEENYHRLVDPWKNPYQYSKADKGFRLFSLGRDGRPGGEGLDADFELNDAMLPEVQVTFSQFIFEGGGSGRLFLIASVAGLCAGLACFLLAGSPEKNWAESWLAFLLSVLVTTFFSFLVVSFLLAIHLVGSGH